MWCRNRQVWREAKTSKRVCRTADKHKTAKTLAAMVLPPVASTERVNFRDQPCCAHNFRFGFADNAGDACIFPTARRVGFDFMGCFSA